MADVTPDDAVVARVKTLAAASSRPVLQDAEVMASLEAHPLPDRDGFTLSDADWTPTWDVNATVAELWGIKAGKVAGDFNFSADDGRYDKGEVMAKCLEMEAKYAASVSGSAPLGEYVDIYGPDPLRGVVING